MKNAASAGTETGAAMHALARRLFPICRSITGEGVRKTLKILREIAPLEISEIPSGTPVFDWTIPEEWNIRDAYVKDARGRRVIDFRKSNLHVVNYSVPFEGRLSLADLRPHLHSLPSRPSAVPYVTSYYKRRWGFCLAHNELKKLKRGTYEVKIDATLAPGSLTYADLLIPGESEQEVIISTYVCHPSLANDNLSGPIVAAFLAKELLARPRRRLSYRFVFVPETIGSIAYTSLHLDALKKNVIAGYVITCAGNPGPFSYLKTRQGELLVDRLTRHVLKHHAKKVRIHDFVESGSDERQYGSPGVDLAVGSLMRTKYLYFPEYHTSDDDLDLITPRGLEESLAMYRRCLDALEANLRYKKMTLCDPQLGRRGLYPDMNKPDTTNDALMDTVNLLAFCDGEKDLLWIADRLGRPIDALAPLAEKLARAGVLKAA